MSSAPYPPPEAAEVLTDPITPTTLGAASSAGDAGTHAAPADRGAPTLGRTTVRPGSDAFSSKSNRVPVSGIAADYCDPPTGQVGAPPHSPLDRRRATSEPDPRSRHVRPRTTVKTPADVVASPVTWPRSSIATAPLSGPPNVPRSCIPPDGVQKRLVTVRRPSGHLAAGVHLGGATVGVAAERDGG